LFVLMGPNAYAQDDVLELEETEVKSSIPAAPDLSSLNSLRNPDKAIDITLNESFIPKIISSMKKNPF
jgi:hypothetical protein